MAIGYEATVSVGALSSPNVSFGLMIQASSGFVNDQDTIMDGLWGLGYQRYPRNSLVVVKPLLDSIFDANPDVEEIFAIDLMPEGGTLTIGGADPAMLRSSTLYWTPIIAQGWYVVNNPQFAIGTGLNTLGAGNRGETTSVENSAISTIVDSGATLIVTPAAYWNALRDGMERIVGCGVKYMCGPDSVWERSMSAVGPPLCYTDFPLSQWPTIAILLPSIGEMNSTFNPSDFLTPNSSSAASDPTIKLILTPSQYMIASRDVQGRPCVAFGFDFSERNFLILGDTLMTQVYTVFDRTNNRVGFAPKQTHTTPIAPQQPLAPSGHLGSASSLSRNLSATFSLLNCVILIYIVWFWTE